MPVFHRGGSAMKSPLLAAALTLAAAASSQAAGPAPSKAILAAVADSGRPAADTARDANRKPAQMVAFAGVKPGQKVADLLPGGGYFTRIFAKIVGPGGKVYAVMPASALQRPGGMDRINAAAAPY